MSLERQTRLRPLRRAVLIGMGACGASAMWPWTAGLRADDTNVTPKTTDRLATGDATAAADVQRAILYEEDLNNPNGLRLVGSVRWSVETVPASADRAAETVVHADIAVAERELILRWTFKRNTDKKLPASHTMDLRFTLPPAFLHGGIQNIPGILMKPAEAARGTPLTGLSVKITAGYFLMGLSAQERDIQLNLRNIKERPWFDVPIVYDDGRRAILAFEKGPPGERALRQAFAAWERAGAPPPESTDTK
jgi:hypothetical protein